MYYTGSKFSTIKLNNCVVNFTHHCMISGIQRLPVLPGGTRNKTIIIDNKNNYLFVID